MTNATNEPAPGEEVSERGRYQRGVIGSPDRTQTTEIAHAQERPARVALHRSLGGGDGYRRDILFGQRWGRFMCGLRCFCLGSY